jgi:predicted glycosyltransferase
MSKMRQDLPAMHQMADVVITSGGYNSLIEAISGGAEIIVSPVNSGLKDEQIRHATQLQKFYPLKIANNVTSIQTLLRDAINCPTGRRMAVTDLELDGVNRAGNLICRDFDV